MISAVFNYGYASRGALSPDELKNMDHKFIIMAARCRSPSWCATESGTGPAGIRCSRPQYSPLLSWRLSPRCSPGSHRLHRAVHLRPGLRFTPDYMGFVGERNGLVRPPARPVTPIELGVLCAMMLPLAVHYAFRSSNERDRPCYGGDVQPHFCHDLLLVVPFGDTRPRVGRGFDVVGMPRRRRFWALLLIAGAMLVLKILVPGMFALSLAYSPTLRRTRACLAYPRLPDRSETGRGASVDGTGIGTWFAPCTKCSTINAYSPW